MKANIILVISMPFILGFSLVKTIYPCLTLLLLKTLNFTRTIATPLFITIFLPTWWAYWAWNEK